MTETSATTEVDHVAAAQILLVRSLNLRPGDILTLVFDETTEAVRQALSQAARNLQIVIREHYAPISTQIRASEAGRTELTAEELDVLENVAAVLTCLSSSSATALFRGMLLNHAVAPGRRLGHMPGVTLDILHYASAINYEQAVGRCNDLTLVLALGQSAELISYAHNADGQQIRSGKLHLGLGGLNRPSISSTGVIPVETWGNLPGGEAFIAPMEHTAEGDYIITGSFENRVLKKGEHILLQFEAGRLVGWEATESVRTDFAKLINEVQGIDPEKYGMLAELGIGVNDAIRRLHGRALLDEKCAGTAHIAIGSNHGYGGTIDSPVHEDLITLAPTLLIDKTLILDQGRYVLDSSAWRSEDEFPFVDGLVRLDSDALIARSPHIRGVVDEAERFWVRRDVSAGRVCLYTLGTRKSNSLLRRAYEEIQPSPWYQQIRDYEERTAKRARITIDEARGALNVLLKHGLAHMRPGQP